MDQILTFSFIVLAEVVRDFDLSPAPGYLENVEKVECENTPRYASTLMLPMVRLFPFLLLGTVFSSS